MMSDDNVTRFPNRMLGMRAQAATLDSELDEQNPSTDSLRGLLIERRALVKKYGRSDGSVQEVDDQIVGRLEDLAGMEKPHER